MVKQIIIYIEGGRTGKQSQILFRKGFGKFFHDLKSSAKAKQIKFRVSPCGSRNNTYDDFIIGLKYNTDAFNVLLVDSESPVTTSPWEHLKNQDNWYLSKSHNEQCHLMVQMMESWLIADKDSLKTFYGQDFNENAIPANPNVEEISKRDVESSLKVATRNTQKGRYHKIHHGPKLLERLDVQKVRNAAYHCNCLFTTLSEKMDEAV